MLILCVSAMCLYLYLVSLVSRVLKSKYFNEHYSVVASKYSICDMLNKTQELTLCSMFKHSPSGKGMVYGPNGKGTMDSIEYSLVIYSPNGKGMIL